MLYNQHYFSASVLRYAAGFIALVIWGSLSAVAANGDNVAATHSAPSNYVPGGSITITGTITYDAVPSSAGITIDFQADGNGAPLTYASNTGGFGVIPVVGSTNTVGSPAGTFSFGWIAVPASGTEYSMTFNLPADLDDDVLLADAVVTGFGSVAVGAAEYTESLESLTINPPPGPTFTGASITGTGDFVQGNGGDVTVEAVDTVITANGTNSITFEVTMNPLDGMTVDRAAFVVANAQFSNGQWEDLDPLSSNPTFSDIDNDGTGGELNNFADKADEADVIEFGFTPAPALPQTLNVVPIQNVGNGDAKVAHDFTWTPAGSVNADGGAYTVTWTPPADLVTKALHPAGKVFYLDIGGIQSNLGQGGQAWVVRVVPVNRAPVAADDTAVTTEPATVEVSVLTGAGADIDPDDEGTPGSIDTLTVSNPTTPVYFAGLQNGASVAYGTVSVTGAGTTVTFDPGSDFEYLAKDETVDVTFDYTVSDGTDTDTATVTVTVTGVNEPSVFTSANAVDVNENETAVLTATATDGDTSDTLVFSKTENAANGADHALFNVATDGTVTFLTAPDFETFPASGDNDYEVELNVFDGTANVTQTLTVSVKNVNELPTFTTATTTPTFAENTDATTIVTVISADDEDAGSNPQFTLASGGDNDLFTLTPGGNLTFNASPNFDIAGDANSDNAYELEVTVSNDGGTTVSQNITVTVTDVNETPVLTVDPAAQIVVIGTTVPVQISLVDPDAQDTWALLKADSKITVTNPTVPATGITVTVGDTPNTLDVAVAGSVVEANGVTFTVSVTDHGDIGTGANPFTVGPETVTVNVIANQQPIVSGTSIQDSTGADVTAVNELETLDFAVTFDDSPNTQTGDNGIASIKWFLVVDGARVGDALETDDNAVTIGAFSGAFSWTPDQDIVMFAANGNSSTKAIKIEALATAHGAQGAPKSHFFDVTVNDVNRAPTIDPLVQVNLLEDAAEETVNLSGITDGDSDAQTITVTASSNNTALVADPAVTYTSADTTGSLKFTPVANANGTATITVTVTDNAGDSNGGDDTTVTTFDVVVTAVNDEPTVDTITSFAIDEDAASDSITLTGVTDGDAEVTQGLTITVTSDNTDLIPNPVLDGETFTYVPNLNQHGSATITVTVKDDGGTENTGADDEVTTNFVITVDPINDAPVAADGSGFTKVDETTVQAIELKGTDVDNLGSELKIFVENNSAITGSLVEATVGATFATVQGGEIEILAPITETDTSPSGSIELTVNYTPPTSGGFRGVDEFYYIVRDDNNAADDSAVATVRITVGTPLWYPFITWSAVTGATGSEWYNVQVREGGSPSRAVGDLVFETNVNGTELTAVEYFLAGFTGFVPGTYTVDVNLWDPVTDIVSSGTGVAPTQSTIVVAYEVADPDPTTSIVDNGSGSYTLNFTVNGARGYDLAIMGMDAGLMYFREIRQIFRPNGDVISLNQPESLDIQLSDADSYDVYIRGFNPLDEANGLSDDLETAYEKFTGSPIVVGAAEACVTPVAPSNLLPKAGDLIALPSDATSTTRTLAWDPVPGATAYYVYLAASTAAPIFNFENVGNNTNISKPLPAGAYTWMVIAQNDCAATPYGPWSTPQQFTVVADLAGPVVTDVTHAGGNTLTIASADGAAPEKVDVRYYSNDTGTGVWVELGEFTLAGTTIDLGGDPALTTGIHYFRISAISADGTTGPSTLFTVTVP